MRKHRSLRACWRKGCKHLQTMLQDLHEIEPEFDIHDMLLDVSTTNQDYVATDLECRRRRTARSSSGSLRPSTLGTSQTVQELTSAMRESLDRAVLAMGAGSRDDARREVIMGMVSDTQLHACRLRVMIALLQHYCTTASCTHEVTYDTFSNPWQSHLA